ncbi:MAG: MobF family relaxase, partial [Actinomycetota bacterium]
SYTRVGRGGAAVVDSDGLVAVGYRHRTSRAMDPQLHDHVLVINAVRTEADGKWRTIDGRQFYRHAKAAGTVYQAALRSELMARLGVRFEPVSEHGQADITGIDTELIDAWSSRSDDIEGELVGWVSEFTNREGRPPTTVEIGKAHKTITLATRDAKQPDAGLDIDTLRDRWARQAADLGVDIDTMITAACSHKAPTPNRVIDADQIIAELTEQRANWTDAHLTQAVTGHIVGGSAGDVLDTVEQLRQQVLASIEVVELAPDTIDNTAGSTEVRRRSDGRPMWVAPSAVSYTTRAHLAREQDIIDWATTDTPTRHRAITAADVNGLDEGQAETVRGLTQHPTVVSTVVGPAGSGKTRMLHAAANAWHSAGINVYGLAPTARAADELAHGANIRADTIHKLLHEHHQRRGPAPEYRLKPGSVVVIDEAGMVNTTNLWAYSRLANRRGWRTVLVGDHHQLDAIGAGGMFAELVHHPDVSTHTLTELHRFTQPWEADATLRLRERDPSVVNDYVRHHRLHAHADHNTAIGHLAQHGARLHADGVDALILTHTRNHANQLNHAITNTLLESGYLDAASGFEIANHTLYPGQRVMARRNDRRIHTSSGDFVRNGDRYTIIGPHPYDGLKAATPTGGAVTIPASYVAAGHLDISYAATIHSAQGATVDETHTLATPTMGADALYVAMTRGRHHNHLHVHPPTFEPDRQHGPLQHPNRPWNPRAAFIDICCDTHNTLDTAINRRQQLRAANIDPIELEWRRQAAADAAALANDRSLERQTLPTRRHQRIPQTPAQDPVDLTIGQPHPYEISPPDPGYGLEL